MAKDGFIRDVDLRETVACPDDCPPGAIGLVPYTHPESGEEVHRVGHLVDLQTWSTEQGVRRVARVEFLGGEVRRVEQHLFRINVCIAPTMRPSPRKRGWRKGPR